MAIMVDLPELLSKGSRNKAKYKFGTSVAAVCRKWLPLSLRKDSYGLGELIYPQNSLLGELAPGVQSPSYPPTYGANVFVCPSQ